MMGLFSRKKRAAAVHTPFCAAIVPAAGSSQRMGGQDKLLMPLGGVPVLIRTLRALDASPYIQSILVVTRRELLVEIGALCRDYQVKKVTTVLIGGETRLSSVYRGVLAAPRRAKLLAIHDGARPLVSPQVIEAAVLAAARGGAACPALPLKDTVKAHADGLVTETLPRETLMAVQTPQVFDADLLRAALQKAVQEGWSLTDDCSAVERLGATVTLTPGSEENLKLTTPLDFTVAEAILAKEAD